MRRLLVTAAVFLLTGAVVNVAVAWGLAACLDIDGGDNTRETIRSWWVYRVTKPGMVFVMSQQRAGPPDDMVSHPLMPRYWRGMKHRADTPVQPWPGNQGRTNTGNFSPYFSGLGWGWPCKALWHDYEAATPAKAIPKNAIPLPSTIVLSPAGKYTGPHTWPRALPLRFIVPGFTINTLFYATILYMPFAPFALRRFIRQRRGLCLRCGYPMGDSPVCTECGRDLPVRAAT